VLKELARRAEEVSVPEGAFLCHQGASCDEVSIILEGSFVMRRHNRKVDTRKKGDFIGALSLIEGRPWNTNVVAVEDSVVLVVHREDFEELLEIPRVARTIMTKLATGLREAEERILKLSPGGAESARRKSKSPTDGARKK
jgi:CRP-like cAMP-binding protein